MPSATPPDPSLPPSRLPRHRPSYRDLLATNRGGGLYSEAVSQRVGAVVALLAGWLRVTPTGLTLVNLLLGVGASIAVIASPRGAYAGWIALAGWQLAYAFDCADGQLARVTARTSVAGARLDILCDVATQIGVVTAVSTVALAHRQQTPVWLVAAFAGTWMVNLVTSVLQTGPNAASMLPSRSLPVRLVKLVRDYGAVVLVIGVILVAEPSWTAAVLWLFTAVNGSFLLASIITTTATATSRRS